MNATSRNLNFDGGGNAGMAHHLPFQNVGSVGLIEGNIQADEQGVQAGALHTYNG